MRVLIQWAVEQWCHAHCNEASQPVVVSDMVVPREWTAWVIAEAERFCQEAAAQVTV